MSTKVKISNDYQVEIEGDFGEFEKLLVDHLADCFEEALVDHPDLHYPGDDLCVESALRDGIVVHVDRASEIEHTAAMEVLRLFHEAEHDDPFPSQFCTRCRAVLDAYEVAAA